jgi:ribonuclease HI
VVLGEGQQRRILKGRKEQTTSNSLALRAATEGLRALGSLCAVTVYTTSNYLCKGASQWVSGWRQNGWRTKSGDPVQNRAEWEMLLQAAQRHQVTWQLVKSKNLTDDLAEAKRLATQEARRD